MGAQTCNENGSGFDPCLGCDTPATSTSGQGGASSSTSGAGGQGGTTSSAASTTTTGGGCMPGPNTDLDQDGFTPATGDCNDCNPLVSPGAIEIAGNALDDDCDGQIDNVAPTCDQGLTIADNDPLNAAKAADLCKVAAGPKDWGVVSAKWVSPDGAAPPNSPNYSLGHGLLPDFGPNVHVQSGKTFLALSSGTARRPTDPGYQAVSGFDKGFTSNSPQGFPKQMPACPGTLTGTPHDGAALEIALRAPSNVHGFSFDFNYFSSEWPGFICSQYNDMFLAMMTPIPAGLVDGNLAFDPQGNFISVNTAFLDVCGCPENPPLPCKAGGKTFPCSLGNKGLLNTGFQDQVQDHGSTGWLTTTAPIVQNVPITIRWTTFDSGDGVLDSSVLIDHWQWLVTTGLQVGTTRILNPI